ncbi:MAG TPA: hypothetical protein VFM69_00660 [Pricia sp.]|nr:hypothetical protein [Pricia sp.]
MKKEFYNPILLIFMGTLAAFGQSSPIDDIDAEDIPQERLFVHYNTSLLLAGEYLYYSIYCRSATSESPSTISKVAYVELIGENGESVFLHKIFLDAGRGQGDFFVPVSVKSGNYTLLGFTQWMKNGGVDLFFQGDVSIINPYRSNQTALLATAKDSLFIDDGPDPKDTNDPKDPIGSNDPIGPNDPQNREENIRTDRNSNDDRKRIGILSLNDSVFGQREKVQVILKAGPGSYINGNYSLSVRKTDPFDTHRMVSSGDFDAKAIENSSKGKDTLYLPEMRGDLVSGKVISKNGSQLPKDIKVAMSISGEENMTKVSSTHAKGTFYLNLDKPYVSDEAIFQILGKGKNSFGISLDPEVSSDYSEVSFNRFELVPQMEDFILERSVHNQIENAYFSVKPDTLVPLEGPSPAYRDKMQVYDLDRYTRFPTVRTTLVEIVDHVYSQKVADENYRIQVRSPIYDTYIPPNAEPLVLVDGVLVQDHNYLLDYDARKIKRIGVLQNKYILGPQIFQGVVVMETVDGDFKPPGTDDFTIAKEIVKPLARKKYFSPVYNDSPTKERLRTPDFRYQLLWKPDVVVTGKETLFSFYTSDLKGSFEISLEGFTTAGKPVSLTKRFRVE